MVNTTILIAGALFLIGFILSLLGSWASLRHYLNKRPSREPKLGFFPISILKPLKGVDYQLEKNLESYFKLDYPEYEILFALTEDTDPAYEVAKRVIEKHPEFPARIIVTPDRGFGNPKVSNLVNIYNAAKHDWVLISDSNVFMETSSLKNIVRPVDEETGVVSASIGGYEPKGFGGHLEATFLNGFYIRWGTAALYTGKPCVIGKLMLFQKSVAARFGGLQAFSNQIAEDFMMGVAMELLGRKVVILHHPVKQRVGPVAWKKFWDRHMRWGRLRKRQAPPAFFFELLAQPISTSIAAGILFSHFFGVQFYIPFFSYLAYAAVSDVLIMKAVNRKTGVSFLFFWLVREILHFPLWIHIAAGNTVVWRGQRFIIERGGLVIPAKR